MKLFKKTATTNDGIWNRNKILKKIVDEIGEDTILVRGSKIVSKNPNGFMVEFSNSNYQDEEKIELIATVYVTNGNAEYELFDLFNFVQEFLGERYRALTIRKNEPWDKSTIKNETISIYKPLFLILDDLPSRKKFLEGKDVEVKGTMFSLPGDEWYRSQARSILDQLK